MLRFKRVFRGGKWRLVPIRRTREKAVPDAPERAVRR